MRSGLLFVLLMGFYLVNSGHADPRQREHRWLIACGVAACAFSTWLCVRMRLVDDEGLPLRMGVKIARYLPWLAWQVVLANVDVARRVWHPDRPIAPRLIRIPYRTATDLTTVIFANSITLTPGTVTVDIDRGSRELLVHALSKEAADDLVAGGMEARVMRLDEP